MYSTQCISGNVQCTSNTIQPESRIKKVETQQKKKKKPVTNDKVQERSLPRGGNIKLKPWRETKVCVFDRRPTCPTVLLLVLHITKSHVAIPHMYRFLLGVSHSHNPKPSLLQSTDPFLSLTFFISIYFPLFLSFPSCSVVVSVPHTFCMQRPSGAGGLSVC